MATSDGAASERERRLDEVITAWLKAVESGQKPDQQEWLTRYPDLAGEGCIPKTWSCRVPSFSLS